MGKDESDFELGDAPEGHPVKDVSAADEETMYETPGESSRPANSLFLRIGKRGHLNWQNDSGTPVLALLMLVLILALILLVALIDGIFGLSSSTSIFTALGQSILAIVGAVIGSSGKRDK